MPNATIYIKHSDYEKWQDIENKSEFIHLALNKVITNVDKSEYCKIHDTKLTAYGKCLQKGCKYA